LSKKTWIILSGIFLLSLSLVIGLTSDKVGKRDTITINYTITLDDGRVYYTSSGREPLQETLGQGMFIPGFEEAVLGMHVGESKTVTIPPEKAYGQYRPDLVGTVERSWLPEDVEPAIGKQVRTRLEDGTQTLVVITDFTDTTLTLDANHPLAGQSLTFDIQIVGVEKNLAASTGAYLGLTFLILGILATIYVFLNRRNLRVPIIAGRRSIQKLAHR